jgi:hypothetical protein
MNIWKALILPVALAITALAAPFSTQAATPGRHPGYMHAIKDLRTARNLIARPDRANVEADESRAVREIDACLNDLQQAAWYDRQNSILPVLPDMGLDFKGRLHKGLDYLRKARADMDKEEDDPAAVGFRANATQHVDRAIGFTRRAIGEKFNDSFLHF